MPGPAMPPATTGCIGAGPVGGAGDAVQYGGIHPTGAQVAAGARVLEECLLEYGQIRGVNKPVAVEVGLGIGGEKPAFQVGQIGGVDYVVIVEIGITTIADEVLISVALVGVGHLQAIVLRIQDAVVVRIAW